VPNPQNLRVTLTARLARTTPPRTWSTASRRCSRSSAAT
jgi:hypothetical protein